MLAAKGYQPKEWLADINQSGPPIPCWTVAFGESSFAQVVDRFPRILQN